MCVMLICLYIYAFNKKNRKFSHCVRFYIQAWVASGKVEREREKTVKALCNVCDEMN